MISLAIKTLIQLLYLEEFFSHHSFLFFLSLILIRYSLFPFLFILIIYWIFLVPFSTEITHSIRLLVKICIGLLALPLGYILIRDLETFKKINISILFSSIIIVSYWYFANLFQVGDFSYIKTYTNQVLMGLGDGKLYTAGLCFFILPYLTKFEPKLKRYNFIIYGLYCLLFIYALFSLRRTVLILVFLSALITFRKDLQKSLRISFIIITFLISIFPFIQDQLESRIDLRRDRITTSINTEVRWSEPSILIDEFNQEGISMVIFGKELLIHRAIMQMEYIEIECYTLIIYIFFF